MHILYASLILEHLVTRHVPPSHCLKTTHTYTINDQIYSNHIILMYFLTLNQNKTHTENRYFKKAGCFFFDSEFQAHTKSRHRNR